MRQISIILTILSILTFQNASGSTNFPVTGDMINRVEFWTKVYTEVSTQEAFIHDENDLTIIYEKVNLPSNRRKRRRYIKSRKREIKSIIRSIAKKNYIKLNSKENRIAKIIGEKSQKELRRLASGIRTQSGLRDRYLVGLKRSYLYLEYIRETFKKLNIPEELIFLPHVESSFNYKAYSKVGAAGIWQFMRATARIYKLKVNYIIDERRDPIKATVAAAKLLRDNYRLLKSWPLALTAYNHGPRSMKRAQKKLKTNDINVIINGYKGRRFGFASKNFYATFMATVNISKDPTRYFKAFQPPEHLTYSTIKLNRSFSIKDIQKVLKLKDSIIKDYNPSIRRIAYRSQLALPKDLMLKIPLTSEKIIKEYELALSKLKIDTEAFDLKRMHIVSRGESLFDISRIYRINMNKIIAFNQISNPSRIYPGMKIKIPGKKQVIPLPNKISEKSAPSKRPEIKPEVLPNKYKDNQKVDSFLSKVKSFIPSKEKKVTLKDNSLTEPEIPSPLINLESYLLDLVIISENYYELTIEDQETLGHIADWANISTQKIRDLNSFRRNQSIHRGQKIKVLISSKNIVNFKEERNRYHVSIQEDFYSSYSVKGSSPYSVRSGDTLDAILQKRSLPYWLLRKNQKNGILKDSLQVGQILSMPKISKNLDTE